MDTKKVLLEMGFVPRFIKTLNDKQRRFISSLKDIYNEILALIKIQYPQVSDSIISVALSKLSYYEDVDDIDFFNTFEIDFYEIIKKEKIKENREDKLKTLFGESKIYSFSEFSKLF
jgi:hypothetical protein